MIQKPAKKALLMIASVALFGSGLYWIAERYFFDKFFYQKSAAHGYWTGDSRQTVESFGRRSEDIREFQELLKSGRQSLREDSDDSFTVVLIGDSFVWGSGIRNSDRFAVLLENRLNSVAPARVISLGWPGDGFIDSYIKYTLSLKTFQHVDMVVVGVVDNDMIPFRSKNRYDQNIQELLIKECGRPVLFSDESPVEWNRMFDDDFGYDCIFKLLLQRYSTTTAVFFDYGRGDVFGNSETNLQRMLHDISSKGFTVVSARTRLEESCERNCENMRVSRIESHPSAAANRIFADELFSYIMTQPGFRRLQHSQ